MHTRAVVIEAPERLSLSEINLDQPGEADVVVEMDWSGISTGTERLLWSGQMPPFPGMGYPLVPGYESVGRVVEAGPQSGRQVGEQVFVPGARCYGEVRGLFGGTASHVVIPGERTVALTRSMGEEATLLALAATAYHAIAGGKAPELIVGHGVLGRLLARVTQAVTGKAPVVWETNAARRAGARGDQAIDPEDDTKMDYASIYDVSGDHEILDRLVTRLAPQGEITLAGFYHAPLQFAFPPAFMREARFRVAAEWRPGDMAAVLALIDDSRLKLDGLITHRQDARTAPEAYQTAFGDPDCLKMILQWKGSQ